MGALARTIALGGSDEAVRAAPTVYCGFSVRETAGSTATLLFYDNASAASGTLVDTVALAAGESRSEFYPGGIWCVNGIFVDVTGTVQGSVRIG